MQRVYLRVPPNAETGILHTMKEIAAYMRVHPGTMTKYIAQWGFPVCLDLKGRYFTSKGAIDQWILAIAAKQHEDRYGKK